MEFSIKEKLPCIHLAAGSDDMRVVLSFICIQQGLAIATDAHKLVYIKLSDFIDSDDVIKAMEGKLLSKHLWTKLVQLSTKDFSTKCEFDGELFTFKTRYSTESYPVFTQDDSMFSGNYISKYPNWIKVWNDVVARPLNSKPMHLNSNNLKKCIKAMLPKASSDFSGLQIEYRADEGPGCVLLGVQMNDAIVYGLVMPIMAIDFNVAVSLTPEQA